MSVIFLLILAGGTVAFGFLIAFVWAVRSGQFDDIASPPIRVLFDDTAARAPGHPTSPLQSKDRTHADDVC